MRREFIIAIVSVILALSALAPASALSTCEFATSDLTMRLLGDCTTDTTISIPQGHTLDGMGHRITAIDPVDGHFTGAIIANEGDEAHVTRINVLAADLIDHCDAGDRRLRGILLDGASGSITESQVIGVAQHGSSCEEGIAIEARNLDMGSERTDVEIRGNAIVGYQKTGISLNGNIKGTIVGNKVAEADPSAMLVQNGIQVAYDATAEISGNSVVGNQWCGDSEQVGTGILLYLAGPEVLVEDNSILGNADVGIYSYPMDDVVIEGNTVLDDPRIEDCNQHGFDVGIGNYGHLSSVRDNKVQGYEMPVVGLLRLRARAILGLASPAH